MNSKWLEKTFYAVTIGGALMGGLCSILYWGFQTSQATTNIDKLQVKQQETDSKFEEIRIRLTHIEDAVIDPGN